MKKKVGELYDKPIVVGNPNEFTKNEIALSKLGGGSFDDGMEYYKILNPIVLINKFYLSQSNAISALANDNGVVKCFNLHPDANVDIMNAIAFQTSNKISYGVYGVGATILKEELIGNLEYSNVSLNDTNLFQRITAKEYYSLLD